MSDDTEIFEEWKRPLAFREEFIENFSKDLFELFYARVFQSRPRTFTIKSLATQLAISRTDAQHLIACGEQHGIICKYHSYWQIPPKSTPAFDRAMQYLHRKVEQATRPTDSVQEEEEKKRKERSDDYPADDETKEEFEDRLRASLREDIEENA